MKKPLGGQQATLQFSSSEKTVAAPIGGLNFRDPVALMPRTDALVLDNIICRPGHVEARKGMVDFSTGFGVNETIWSLLPYRAAPVDRLFAATDFGIYDVTETGAIGAAVADCTSGRFESINGSNAGIRYLLAVNGVDPMKFYNGTDWADAAITGISSSALFTNISQFKFRVFLTEKDTLNFWYLAVNAVQGAATVFPLAPLFTKGGSLLASGNWTMDGGNGPDDYCAFITTEGEVAIYQGTDPSNADNWALVGVYSLPRPIGRKCLFKYGGDLLVITESGIVKMSKMLQSTKIDYQSSVSDKINGGISEAAGLFKANFGWSLTQLSSENLLILNIPVNEGGRSVQFVMNTITEAWSMFKGMSAQCFCEFGARLFYGMQQKVVYALTGYEDLGANMTVTAKTAFMNFGYPLKTKQVKLLRPNYQTNKQLRINLAIAVNYQLSTYINPGSTTPNNQSLFDVSVWDGARWADSEFLVDQWRSASHKPGAALATLLQITDKNFIFKWNSTDYLIAVGFGF